MRTASYLGMALVLFLFAFSAAKAHEVTLADGQVVNYKNWVNKNSKGCCNDQHCRPVPVGFERTREGQLEVLVIGKGVAEGQWAWCPILATHYLKTGNVPNSSVSHYCVWENAGTTPCGQLLCYQPETLY